jgi:hypothetical protein
MIKVTAVMKRSLTKLFLPHLFASGLTDWYVTAARTMILREKRGGLGLIHVFKLVEDAADIVSFLIEPSQEEQSLDFVIEHCDFTLPGRGSVFSEEVELVSPHDFRAESKLRYDPESLIRKPSPLVGVCCVVQRGEANRIARVALDMGAGVPAVSFGNGTGIRDKLGLLRIAIPAQKEVIHLALSPHDAETVMRMMIRAGELDRPGKGFMFNYPVRKGWLDTKITHGFRRHVASVEQIIAALDEMKGDMGWRRRSNSQMLMIDSDYFIYNLIDITIICNEGYGYTIANQAMDMGASGATICRSKQYFLEGSKPEKMSPAREACTICIPDTKVDEFIQGMENSGAFDEQTSSELLIRKSPKAYTYS